MLNISLLHHWLVSLRGGEKVLEQFCLLFPEAAIHTLVQTRSLSKLGEIIPEHEIKTTLLNKLPSAEHHYKSLLPFFPQAIGNYKVAGDFILSSDASLIKGIKKDDNVPHVCYCHSPPRYLWDLQEEYLKGINGFKSHIFKKVTPYLRDFDQKGAANVDHFIANSKYVQKRIQRTYGRKAEVIHPPVELANFDYTRPAEDFYLIVAALVPYKRIDIAVEAFNRLGKKLVVIGNGSELSRLESLAKSNVKMMGQQPFNVLKEHYERCKAFIFPGIEDFGITPLEAQAAGKPVIAIGKGGALETVIENETGIFFEEQTPEALINAVEEFERNEDSFSPEVCRRNAEKFDPERFRYEIKSFLTKHYPSYFLDFSWDYEKKTEAVNY